MEEEISEKVLNLGEQAHIVGWINTQGSPRGISNLPIKERNKSENLMLLCMSCHKVIDDPTTRSDYPVELLLSMKQEHEDRILHLTGISPDRETVVLRVLGGIRESHPEFARDAALQTVIDGAGRYAKFPLAATRHSIELDLTGLPDPEVQEGKAYWDAGRIKIDALASRISDYIQEKEIRHLSVFALTRIPFLMYLGYVIDDKIPVDFYQKHRGADEGWLWPEDDSEPVRFETIELHNSKETNDVSLILSLSGSIKISELPSEMLKGSIYEIRPKNITPNRDLFRSQSTITTFARSYHDFLSQLETREVKPHALHLFPAIPITAAIACGRGVMRHVHPAITVYDRISNKFKPTLTINEL